MFVYLRTLNIKHNNLLYLEPLRRLTNLKEVDVSFNQIQEADELQVFENFRLKSLSVYSNPFIEDVTMEQVQWIVSSCMEYVSVWRNSNEIELIMRGWRKRNVISPFKSELRSVEEHLEYVGRNFVEIS